MEPRLSKDEYYLSIARKVGERATCFRNKGGSIIVRDDQIISTGYIGAPRKTKDCLERGECLRDKLKIPHGTHYEMCRSVHSEMNAIINAARAGVSLLGGDLYLYNGGRDGEGVDGIPCFICKKMIINAGIKRVVGSKSGGGYKLFQVADWARDWQEKDLVDDKEQFGQDSNKAENLG